MSSSAKVLQFRRPQAPAGLSVREARRAACDYFALSEEDKVRDREHYLGSADVLLSACSVLKQNRDFAPAGVLEDASSIYHWIVRSKQTLGLFDERDYFLGELALIAGGVCRQLGKREEAFLWLDRSEAGFRHTMNPAPGLANVAYARLALRFEMGRYTDVLELGPSLESSFSKLRMDLEAAKCRLLLATTLKMTGEHSEALALLEGLHDEPSVKAEPFLAARILAEHGDVQQSLGDYSKALISFQAALALLEGNELSAVRADLKVYVGVAYGALGTPQAALEAFRAAQRDYQALQMRPLAAYAQLLVAEALLQLNRQREAEWEVLGALPAIEEMNMVPEAMAAAALLRESVRRKKTDTSALASLRTHLEARG